jgi:hypothetical protein
MGRNLTTVTVLRAIQIEHKVKENNKFSNTESKNNPIAHSSSWSVFIKVSLVTNRDVALCILVGVDQHFGGACCLHHQADE